MNTKWLAFFAFVWVIGIFLGATFEKHDVPTTWAGNTETTTLEYMFNFNNVAYQHEILGVIAVPMPNPEFFQTWGRVMLLRFDFTNDYEIIYWVLIAPLALAGAFSLIYGFIGFLQGFIPTT